MKPTRRNFVQLLLGWLGLGAFASHGKAAYPPTEGYEAYDDGGGPKIKSITHVINFEEGEMRVYHEERDLLTVTVYDRLRLGQVPSHTQKIHKVSSDGSPHPWLMSRCGPSIRDIVALAEKPKPR